MAMLSTPTARFAPRAALPGPIVTSRKTILLVHQSRTASAVQLALAERGYDVLHAESLDAAFRIWSKMTTPIDLFLADITRGRDQGVERLVQMMQAENPRLRVLYANDLDQPSGPLLSQRYPQQLVAVVENCLG